jgi:hypothetical protein
MQHHITNRSGQEHYSMPLFFGTNYDVLLEVTLDLPSHQLDANAAPVSAPPELHLPSDPKIQGHYCWDYVQSRLAATYVHSKSD